MPYVLVAPQHAEQLSRSIMRLLRPSHLRGDNWTDLYCAVIRHPTSGQAALALPDEEVVPIHVDADGQELAAMLGVFVADNALTQQEADAIVAAVRSQAGNRVRIADFVPPSWAGNVMTEHEMREAWWFPPREIPEK